ncbi:MAG TPA: ABC transporter ATP-binding protein [Candidatus Dormibacteraeota bacterium]|nr:ABC transporter ATP-binding protein [Candidatus Dormibacteraeota bacterium]
MSAVSLRSLVKRYGAVTAVSDLSLEVADGELLGLLGPSGCGKTTTLRMVAGFIDATAGRILIGDRDVTHLPPNHRNTGMVFQGYALFPHMSVFDNVAFGLRMRKLPRARVQAKVGEALQLVRLEQFAQRMPAQLSGGQQQRVALARALVVEPDVLLLDEPLSNLDAKLRNEVRLEIRQLQQRLRLTTIFVTHDQEEALTMADRLAVMDHGVIQQVGTPLEVYSRPLTRFVADFIGKSNFFSGRLVAPGRFQTGGGLEIRVGVQHAAPEDEVALAIRPEELHFGDAAPADRDDLNALPARIEAVTFLGSRIELVVSCESGDRLVVHAQAPRSRNGTPYAQGDRGYVSWPADGGMIVTS